jgi:hypothetical protein
MDSILRWVFVGVLLFGSPFVAVGACEAVKTSNELAAQVRTEGTVVDNRLVTDRRDGNDEHAYLPVVEYVDGSGKAARFTDPVGSLPADYAVGERVPIAVDPRDASRSRITSWKRLWLAPTIFVAAGLLPVLVCAVVFWRISRRTPR